MGALTVNRPPASGTTPATDPSSAQRLTPPPDACSFCSKSEPDVVKVITGPAVNICNECIELCVELLPMPVGCLTAGEAMAATRAREAECDRWVYAPFSEAGHPELVARVRAAAERIAALTAERDAALARVRALDDACLDLRRAVDHAEEMVLHDDAAWAEQRERVAALEAIVAGRTTAPTLAEVRAHEARGGDWLYHDHDPDSDIPDGALSPEVWYILTTPDDEIFARHIGHRDAKCGRVYEHLPEGRWWAWNNGPVAWPVTP